MNKMTSYIEDLSVIRTFMKNKRITLTELSREMNYSLQHVSKVFNNKMPIRSKFMDTLFHSLHGIMKRDLKEFYEITKGMSWEFLEVRG